MARKSGQSFASWRALAAIAGAPDGTVPRLARHLGLSRQSVQRLCDRLAEQEFVRYEANPHHRRSPRVRVTNTGRTALESLDRSLAAWESDWGQDFELEELETTLHVLRSLGETLRA